MLSSKFTGAFCRTIRAKVIRSWPTRWFAVFMALAKPQPSRFVWIQRWTLTSVLDVLEPQGVKLWGPCWPCFCFKPFTTRWWFQRFFIFTPIWGRFPIWLIFFRWVETTNQYCIRTLESQASEFMVWWFPHVWTHENTNIPAITREWIITLVVLSLKSCQSYFYPIIYVFFNKPL